MTYRAVGFDYGGVITGEPSSELSKNISKLLRVKEEKYREAYYNHNLEFNRGLISREEFWTTVLAELDRSDKLDQLTDFFKNSNFGKFNNLIVQLADSLRAQGFKVGLLSNNSLEGDQQMRDQGLAKHFDVFDISAETGLVKPEAGAFHHLAEGLGVDIRQLIFIDDSEKSLSTSSEVGYQPILYKNYKDLIKQLKALGIPT